jgi:DNA-binding NarL/FixJ family response regulator
MRDPLYSPAADPAAYRTTSSRVAAIRVFVVDDHPVARGGLAVMLSNADGIEWVGEAGSAADALRAAPAAEPDVVLMDDELPGMDGIHAVQLLRQQLPRTRFLMLMRQPDASLERRASEAGVTDVLPKTAGSEDLTGAIRAAHLGRTPVRMGSASGASAGRQALAPTSPHVNAIC